MSECSRHLLEECPKCHRDVDFEAAKVKAAAYNPNRVAKVEEKAKKAIKSAKVDIFEVWLAQYAMGVRCEICDGIKDDRGMCAHTRRERFEAEKADIMAFARDQDTRQGRFIAQSGMRRVVLRAGIRDDGVPGIDVPRGAFESAIARRHNGITPRWSDRRPGGIETPV